MSNFDFLMEIMKKKLTNAPVAEKFEAIKDHESYL
jgi:hypothetical protein